MRRHRLHVTSVQGVRYYGGVWKAYILVSLCAWVASAVFHARDTFFTERLDYMAAFATVVTGLAVSVIRCFCISRCSSCPSLGLPLVAGLRYSPAVLNQQWLLAASQGCMPSQQVFWCCADLWSYIGLLMLSLHQIELI